MSIFIPPPPQKVSLNQQYLLDALLPDKRNSATIHDIYRHSLKAYPVPKARHEYIKFPE